MGEAVGKISKLGKITTKPLTLAEIILYNLAGFSFNVYDTILYAWVAYFYMPPEDSGLIKYVPLGVFGLILALGRVLDAVTDPLIGYWSDRTKSRWGRRKPYIFVSAPILFISFLLVWTPPVKDTAIINAVYLGVVLFFYYWAYTGVLIPWFAVLPEMSPKNEVRVKIASIGVAIGILGALMGGGLSGSLYEKYGPLAMALALGFVAFIASELTLFGIHQRHHIELEEDAPGFFRVLKESFGDRQIISFLAMMMFVQLTYQLMLMNVPYLTKLILGRGEEEASILMGLVIIVMAASVPLWYKLFKKYKKRNVFRGIIGWMILGFSSCFFIGYLPLISPFIQTILFFSITAIPIGGMFAGALVLIADITDYDELKSKKRREAIYYGIYGIVRKTGWALCSLILVGVFATFGYSEENVLGVRVIWLVCAMSCLIGLLAFIPYKLGDSKEETKKIMGL
jgi:GPH family glycoside/pentoside/hexuronide:cation symporter